MRKEICKPMFCPPSVLSEWTATLSVTHAVGTWGRVMDEELETLRMKDDYTEEDIVTMFRLLTEQIKAGQDSIEQLRRELIRRGRLEFE